MVPHSSTLAWKIPWMEERGRLQSMRLLKSRTRLSDFTFTFHFHALEKEMATHSSVLAWRIPGTGEPGGLPSMGSHRVGHDWSDLAAAHDDIRCFPVIYYVKQCCNNHTYLYMSLYLRTICKNGISKSTSISLSVDVTNSFFKNVILVYTTSKSWWECLVSLPSGLYWASSIFLISSV